MVVQRAVRRERVVHAVADGVPQLLLGHATVQRKRGDEVDVVDARGRGLVEHGFDHPLTDVGAAHRRQRQGDVVEADRELHARVEQRAQRLAVAERVRERMADLGVDVVDALERLGGVDDAAAAGGQPLEPEALAVVEQDRRRRPVDLEHEPGTRH